jgi:uncharacterized protein (TIGR02266 family)
MGKKKKRKAKSAKKRKRTMLPPSVDAGASTQQPLAALAALTAEAVAHDPLASLELESSSAPKDMTPTVPEVEHRAAPRTSLVVELHMASDSHFFSGLSGDISEGGVFVSTYRDLATGTPVDLEFELPGSSRVVHAKGEVRWHRSASPGAPPGVGIAFEELTAEDRALIHRFCTLRPPLYYDDVG